ncbi:hypothetical protein VSX64_24300 [Aurantimonas sp. C2-6-R+9]|uniref:hypothetical protein n=1 Tax=unclassified Aurantimonas TaxID=2638230 RepID=UPI002E19AF20|nr:MULTISPECIES: hypothetical protein [unclassified Aurantimonas]MEC5293349.1 hypothetical protein [Aurantimonas sp. C2-3-R2]MEC5383849.1 hypothetical protein [Aurantimonas sp. C2-6-R+9]MEC5414432.1 hypothetical protein [Aurantimonas sp. C2-4-R8]
MTAPDLVTLGKVVQNHVREKWSLPPAWPEVAAEVIPDDLRKRISYLGIDDFRLLEVRPEQVPEKLRQLEEDSAREDAGIGDPSGSARPTSIGDLAWFRRPRQA